MNGRIGSGWLWVLLPLLSLLPAGCQAGNKVAAGIYEGVQMHYRQAATTGEQPQATTPGYDEYLRQRRRITGSPPPAEVAGPVRP